MNFVASTLQYLGLIITSIMALLSLFFDFTEKGATSGKKKLTRQGRWAFGLTVVGVLTSFASTIAKDVIDNRKSASEALERKKLLDQIAVGTRTFRDIKVVFQFDQTMDWTEPNFISVGNKEQMYGTWSGANKINSDYAQWCITKDADLANNGAYKRHEILFIETRADKIKSTLEQNVDKDQLVNPPTELGVVGSLDEIKNYQPPSLIHMIESHRDIVIGTGFDFPQPSAQIEWTATHSNNKQIVFSISAQAPFEALLGSSLGFGYSLETAAVTQQEPSVWGKRPKELPFLLQHLVTVELFLDEHLIKRLYDRSSNSIQFKQSSVWDLEHNSFGAGLGSVVFDRDTIMKVYE